MSLIETFFNHEVLWSALPALLRGFINTLLLGLMSIAIGVPGGMVVGVIRLYAPKPIRLLMIAYIDIMRARADIQTRVNTATAPFDAILMPSTAIVAPRIDELVASDDLYGKINPLILRNTTVGNFLDRCAFTIPCHEPGDPPVGLMVVDHTGADDHLVRISLAVEPVVRRS